MILIIIILALVLFFFIKKRKKLNLPDVTLVSGGVKTGKSTLACFLALRAYKRELFRWRVRNFFRRKNHKLEKPLLYSNIPLSVEYVPLTADLLYMRERLSSRCVVFIDEASLLCDSMNFKDYTVNEAVKRFFKLFGHISHGGKLFMATHTPKDVHYNIKRSLAQYLFITRSIKWIPFIYVVNVRELIYCEENVQNVYTDDINEDDSSYWIVIPKSVWNKFDYCCYSKFTDDLPEADNVTISTDLKTTEVLDFENKNY